MKILFVCRANVGRSQFAESIFNNLSKKHNAISAGVAPGKWEGKGLHQAKYMLPALTEIGINAHSNISKKLTEEMINSADKIFVLGVDKEKWPEFLKKSKKVTYWSIKDPAHGDMQVHRNSREEIREKILELLQEIDT